MTQEELEAEFNVGYLTAFSVLVQDGVDVPQGVPQDVPQGKKNDTQDDTRDTQVSTSNDTKEENLDDWIDLIYAKIPR